MNRKFLVLTCGALAAVILGTSILRTPPSAVVQTPNYLERAAGEALLPPDSRNEILRRVLYASDGFTRQRLVVYFTNGDTGVTIFHSDGSLDVYRYHPTETDIDWKASKLSDKNLKFWLRISTDGKSVKDERLWDVNGNLIRVGLRLPSGGFQVQGFYSDGKPFENSLYSIGGVLESQLTYWQNGKPKIVFKQANAQTKEWSSFAEDGKKIAWSKMDGGNERGEFFHEDGVTVRMRYVKEFTWAYYSGNSTVTATYYDRTGAQTQSRLYRHGSFTVTTPKIGSTPAFAQNWRVLDTKRAFPAILAPDNVALDNISIARFEGLDNAVIYMKDGKVFSVRGDRKSSSGSVETVVRHYRPDGTLEKELVRAGGTPKERTFTGDSGGRISLPGAFLSGPPSDLPPTYPAASSYYGDF